MNYTKIVAAALLLGCIAHPTHAADADDEAAVRKCAVDFMTLVASGEREAVSKSFAGDGPERELASAMVDASHFGLRLREAVRKQFGDKAQAALKMRLDNSKLAARYAVANVTIEGDSAFLKDPEKDRKLLRLKKVEGKWQVSSVTGSNASTAQALKLFMPLSNSTRVVAENVEAGKYDSMDAVNTAVDEEVRRAVQAPATRPSGK